MQRIYIKLVCIALFWGGTFVAGRLAVQEAGVFTVAAARFAIATLFLFGLAWCREGQIPTVKRAHWGWILLLGLSGVFIYNWLFFWALKTVPASRAALIVAMNPVAIALGAALWLGEPLSRLKLCGIGLSLSGAAIVIGQGNPFRLLQGGITLGDGLLLGCLVCWAVYTLAGKRALRSISTLSATTYACLVGAIAFLGPAVSENGVQQMLHLSLTGWIAILYMGVFGSAIAAVWYYEGVQAIGAAKAAIFINLVPPSAILFAAWLLHEPITLAIVVGGFLVITGIVCTNRV